MKPIRLQVQMPTIGMYSIKGRTAVGEVEQLVETMVDGLRRREFKGVLAEDLVLARAFVPEQFRRHLREKGRLIDGEYAWCIAMLADNKKSLAPFIASGDREWKTEESNVSAIKINTSRTNTTTHRATVSPEEIKRLLHDEVCRQIGIDPGAEHVGLDVRLSSRMGNYGSEFDALVIVTVQHDAAPQAAGE
jgi:hypothetical protein